MKKYKEKQFTGERALFQSHDLDISYCTFTDGESALKESGNLNIRNSLFRWKYSLWYCNNVSMEDCVMFDMARAGIWYTNKLSMNNVTIEAPKTFRRCSDIRLDTVDMPNASETLWNCDQFAVDAMIAAYTKGEDWLDELRNYLSKNKKIVANYLEKEIPNVKLVSSDATYLLWLDCLDVLGDAAELCRFIRQETGLYLSEGSKYKGNGNYFIRMNIACPTKQVEEGLIRLKEGVRAYQKWAVEQC